MASGVERDSTTLFIYDDEQDHDLWEYQCKQQPPRNDTANADSYNGRSGGQFVGAGIEQLADRRLCVRELGDRAVCDIERTTQHEQSEAIQELTGQKRIEPTKNEHKADDRYEVCGRYDTGSSRGQFLKKRIVTWIDFLPVRLSGSTVKLHIPSIILCYRNENYGPDCRVGFFRRIVEYEGGTMKSINKFFTKFTGGVSSVLGRPWIFVLALVLITLWAISGPLLGFSDTWQLIVNTSTTIITFLTVFIIQNTQNRDSMAVNIKLDALLKKSGIDSEELMKAEDKSDVRLEKDKKQMQNGRRTNGRGKKSKRP